MLVLAGCGPQNVKLVSATYGYEGLRGRDGAPSATVTGAALEVDALTRELKVTISNVTRKFTLAADATWSPGCQASAQQETRSLDAPNLQLGELLVDAPLLRADCPTGSGVVVLQQGPLSSTGAAPDCSAEVLCLTFKKR
jgi:hypothetical protein